MKKVRMFKLTPCQIPTPTNLPSSKITYPSTLKAIWNILERQLSFYAKVPELDISLSPDLKLFLTNLLM